MELSSTSLKIQRNIKERDRRTQMKYLIERLAPLVHSQPLRLAVSEVLNHATNYIKQLQKRVEKLKLWKDSLHCKDSSRASSSSRTPVLHIGVKDSILQVNLVTGLVNNLLSNKLIHLLQEGGAEVTSFTYHNAGNTAIYTIISQTISPRIGMDIPSIYQRIKELIY